MNNVKNLGVLLFSLFFLAFSTLSCATLEEAVRENPKTAIGATVGTLGGAIIGGTVFDSAGAAVAGGLIGGLAGGIVGRVLEKRNEDYASTARDYNFTSGQRTVVRVEDVDADPDRVRLRDKVHLVARYALLPSDPNREVRVTERWEIMHNGRVVGNPVITVTRKGGTWSSAIPVELPVNAERGLYRARVEVSADGAVDQGSTTFTIG
jgi:hypothetical protein